MRNKAAGLRTGSPSGLIAPSTGRQERCAFVRPTGRILSHATEVMTALFLFVAVMLLATPTTTQATDITNSAWLYSDTGLLSKSNVTVSTIERTPADLIFYIYRPTSSLKQDIPVQPTEYHPDGTPDGTFSTLPPPDFYGTTLPEGVPLPLVETDNLTMHIGEPLFITLADSDQNRDAAVMETILVTISSDDTADEELLRLTETGPDTGVFSGHLMTTATVSNPGNGTMGVTLNSRINGLYVDIVDNTDTSADTVLVDPFGVVFDSVTGNPVNGVMVTLYDVTNDRPADDIRDDLGQLGYPHTVETGDTDLGSPEGGFRFPLIVPNRDYRLDIVVPPEYTAPSTVAAEVIRIRFPQFAIDDNASYGGSFPVNPGPAIHIDIPIDPTTRVLWLRKDADRNVVAIGDFLQYTIEVDNSESAVATGELRIEDRLPSGFRYQKDSLRIDGTKAADPVLNSDGRTMQIIVSDVAAAQNLTINYVVEVASGAQLGEATNRAVATDTEGNTSNQAKAKVLVRDDFLRNSTFLIGRVMDGSCELPDTEKPGVPGVRVYLEDGRYVDTDSEGKYHFEGVEPGMHVVQVDSLSLPQDYEMLPCEQTSQFAGRSFSQFVDLQGGTLWRVDFHSAQKEIPSGEVALTLNAGLNGNIADFTATATTRSIPANNPHLSVMLPGGFSYSPGSAAYDGQRVADPKVVNGSLSFTLPEIPSDQTTIVTFRALFDGAPESDELPTKAVLSFNTSEGQQHRTPTAETSFNSTSGEPGQSNEIKLHPKFPSLVATLQPTDKVMIEQLVTRLKGQQVFRIDIVGHTDSLGVAQRSRHLFLDNQVLSVARAMSVAALIKKRLALPKGSISVRGVGASMPLADNATSQGRALNRRVEVYIVAATADIPPSLTVDVPTSPEQTIAIGAQTEEALSDATASVSTETVKSEQPKGLLSPLDGQAVNRIESIRIRLDSGLKPRLSIDDQEIPNDRIGFRMTDPVSKTTLYSYFGVDLGEPGTRTLKLEGIGPFGNARFSEETKLVRTGRITSIRLIETAPNLADGRTPVRMRVELIDEFDRPVQTTIGLGLEESSLNPFGSRVAGLRDAGESNEQGVMVMVDPEGWISFDPIDHSGSYPVRLVADGATLNTEIFVKPHMRDWILVGFAEGTAGYNTFSGNQTSLEEAGMDEHFYDDGEVKLFAKGAIKGEWLLTLAYDSDKPNLDGDSLHQIIDPDNFYPLYGDGTNQGYEASSARDVYIKLERDQFYALFGDMNTGLNQTELSRYNRSMNGFKSEMQGRNFSYTVFAADTLQNFEKDEIRGDGTSGRYYLEAEDLVINSEEITIETRDRFHSERIVETKTLSRHTDYDIDYNDGSLFFKQPIPSKDEEFNPVFIVVRYETRGSDGENLNYGGRVATRILNRKVELGASYVHEDRGIEEGDLYGADATVNLTPKTTLHLEAASTDTEADKTDASGEAYLAEIRHNDNRVKALAYYREQDEKFGLGQQNDSETGTRKYGVESTYVFSPKLSASGQVYHEDVLSTGAERDVVELNGRYKSNNYSLHTGVREARDLFSDGEKLSSTQWLAGGTWLSPDRKLNLRADYEQSLGSDDDNSDYPTLLTLGTDYRLTKRISMFAEQEFTWGDGENTEGTRAGFKATPWQGGNVSSTIEQQLDENGQRVYAIFGLGQSWQVNQNWSFDGSLDRSYTVKSQDSYNFNDNVPAAHGSDDDFTAVSLGATCRKDRWTWWSRGETRQADDEDKYGISTSVVVEPQPGVAVSAKALAFLTDVANGTRRTDGNIRFGLAYRPNASRWVTLDRLDFYFDREENSPSGYNNWHIVNNLHTNFKLNRKAQISGYYGLKYVRDNISGTRYSGFTDLIASETRYNINKQWDVGVHGSMLHSWNSETYDYSAGASIGYSPITNTWVSVGYNLVGFEDNDFDSAHYTAQGAYVRFRVKFDQQSVREAVEWVNR